MKICIAQIKPFKGDVDKNLDIHVSIIKSAIKAGGDLVLFPELSLSAFEPTLAEKLVQKPHSPKFDLIQKLALENNIAIGIGMPTRSLNGINISMVIFHANNPRLVYSKNMLHEDELPYFVCGESEPSIEVNGHSIGLGICYESLKREHFLRAISGGAEVYIASVAKPDHSIGRAYSLFKSLSKEFNMPILMVNSVGHCDNFLSGGKSAVWKSTGDLLAALGESDTGLITYDTKAQTATISQC